MMVKSLASFVGDIKVKQLKHEFEWKEILKLGHDFQIMDHNGAASRFLFMEIGGEANNQSRDESEMLGVARERIANNVIYF